MLNNEDEIAMAEGLLKEAQMRANSIGKPQLIVARPVRRGESYPLTIFTEGEPLPIGSRVLEKIEPAGKRPR